MEEDEQKIKYIQNKFRNKLAILQKAKDSIFKLFRNKLEAEKIKQIKDSLLVKDDLNTK